MRIHLSELISLFLLVVPMLVAKQQLFFNPDRHGHFYLETGVGFALLIPFLYIPIYCSLIARRLNLATASGLKIAAIWILGFFVGYVCGLSLTLIPWLDANLLRTLKLDAIALIAIPSKYGCLGLIVMSYFIYMKLFKNCHQGEDFGTAHSSGGTVSTEAFGQNQHGE